MITEVPNINHSRSAVKKVTGYVIGPKRKNQSGQSRAKKDTGPKRGNGPSGVVVKKDGDYRGP